MRVKRYIVDTMPDAMLKIRNELGADAVILSTKQMKVGGFLGMFQKKKIEVIAATESEAPTPKAKSVARPTPQAPMAPVARQTVPEAYRKSSQLAASMASPAVALTSSAVGLKEKPEITFDEGPQLPQSEPRLVPRTLEVIEASSSAASTARDTKVEEKAPLRQALLNVEPDPREERLLEEIRQMKSWICQLAKNQVKNGRDELPEALLTIQNRLMDQELSVELAETWIDEIYEEWLDSGKTLSDGEINAKIQLRAASFLDDRIGEGIGENTRIVYIAGPTGVGKTTTIAKLAADQIFRLHKKVGFITADTYRISAIEQLRTYASILNVPLEVVQSPGDVQRAMQRLEQCDLILMDTAGRNYLNELFVAELHSLLTPSDVSEMYLVLSLTSKSHDMRKITEHFSKYGLDRVIFTKLDETESVGPIYNLLNDYPLKVSYITNGQNVPDDLLQAERELLVNILLGDRNP